MISLGKREREHYMKKVILEIEEYIVHLYISSNETEFLLTEAKNRGIPIQGPYSVRQDTKHVPQGQNHLHIYKGQNKFGAINLDGTAHDKSHGVRIPNKVVDKLNQMFPKYNIPADGYIESAQIKFAIRQLIEEKININNYFRNNLY